MRYTAKYKRKMLDIMAKKDYDLEATKAKILSVAAKLFLTIGYEKSTILKLG